MSPSLGGSSDAIDLTEDASPSQASQEEDHVSVDEDDDEDLTCLEDSHEKLQPQMRQNFANTLQNGMSSAYPSV